jgi:hypothetical protein
MVPNLPYFEMMRERLQDEKMVWATLLTIYNEEYLANQRQLRNKSKTS